MEHQHVAVTQNGARLRDSGRRLAAVDLGVAFVHAEHEIVVPGQPHRRFQVIQAGRRALRVGRRAKVEKRGARQGRLVHGGQVGQEAGLPRRRQEHRLGPRHDRRSRVHMVVRVGDEDGRRGAAPAVGQGQGGGHEQGLAGAGDGQDLGGRVDGAVGQAIAANQPRRHRVPEPGRAADRGIPAPQMGVGGQGLGEHGRRPVLGLADGQRQGLDARGGSDAVEQRPEAGERIGGQPVETGIHHGAGG